MVSLNSLLRVAASALALSAIPASAQTGDAPTGTSMPQAAPLVDTIPPPQDVPYPGTITLDVDATDIPHGIFRIKETIPVKPGHLVLLYPKWLPGNHSPTQKRLMAAPSRILGKGKNLS